MSYPNSEEDNNQNQDAGRRNRRDSAHELSDELGIVTPQGERLLVEALKNVKPILLILNQN